MYKIEKNIEPAKLQKGMLSALLRSMEEGDSFVCPLLDRDKVLTRAKQINIKCTSLKISETEARIWRTA